MRRQKVLSTLTGLMLCACGTSIQTPPHPETTQAQPTMMAVIATHQPTSPDVAEAKRLTKRIRAMYPTQPLTPTQYQAAKVELTAISEWFTQAAARHYRPPTTPLASYKVSLVLQEALPAAANAALLQINAIRVYTPTGNPHTIRSVKNQAQIAINQAEGQLESIQ